MAQDVAQKIIASREIRNGNAVVYVDKQGNIQKLNSKTVGTNDTALFDRLDKRFDDINYYT